MYLSDIVKPQTNFRLLRQFFVQALLSKVFQYDFSSLDCVIARLDCTVLATAVAVGLDVALIATNALPKDIVR